MNLNSDASWQAQYRLACDKVARIQAELSGMTAENQAARFAGWRAVGEMGTCGQCP